ncbi:hypothetical protein HYT91_03225 [Candidatus Pacearchaeota archaeon]|nr:hypothetical protein [Candidatus Pacearchaeota archaeon]
MVKKLRINKKELKNLAKAIKNLELKSKKKKPEKSIEENKFIERGINIEKISPVLKPAAKTQEGLEQITSSFLLRKNPEKTEKPYESENQKYFSQSSEYKTFDKIQNENLQTPSGFEKNMAHMGVEQSTKRKSERFFDEKQEQKYSADIKPLEEVKSKSPFERKDKLYTPR